MFKSNFMIKFTILTITCQSLLCYIINISNRSFLIICCVGNICVFAKILWHKILITNNLILIFYNSTITCDWLCINWFNLNWIGLIISVVNSVVNPCFISTRISSDYLTQLLVLINNVGRLWNVWINNGIRMALIPIPSIPSIFVILCTVPILKNTTLNFLTMIFNYIVHSSDPFTVIFREGNLNAIMIILGAGVAIMEFRNKSTTIISDIV